MTTGVCLLGTDTAAGKTTVACGLLALARRRSLPLLPCKPVETGAPDGIPADAARLLTAAEIPDLTLGDVCPTSFALPLAPTTAARLAGATLDPTHLVDHTRRLARRGHPLLVETAGGLLSPYAPQFTAADLAELLRLPVLLIAPNRLGSINQCALAIAELRRRPLQLAGAILVDTTPALDPDDVLARTHNPSEIADLTGVRPLGVLRYLERAAADAGSLADALAADVDLRPILGGALA